MKKIALILSILLTFSNLFAGAEDIANALEDHLSDAIDFDLDEPANVHRQTKLRRFEDQNPMWLQLFVRPRQNRRFPNYHAKGFKTGRRPYANIPNISSASTFQMRHESPWSYKLSGIGKFEFYRKANYQERFYYKASTDDRPKLYTFGSSSNASKCRCSSENPICGRKLCGKRETIGSVKFCPGVALYEKSNYIGKAALLFKCNPIPRGTHCFNVAARYQNYWSLHFDHLIRGVRIYAQPGCDEHFANIMYDIEHNGGTVPQRFYHPSSFPKVRSIKVHFR